MLSSAACLALPYIYTLSHKGHEFGKEVIEHKMRVMIFSTNSVSNITHSKNLVRYHKYTLKKPARKAPVILVRFK
jgi:hypothetical protein